MKADAYLFQPWGNIPIDELDNLFVEICPHCGHDAVYHLTTVPDSAPPVDDDILFPRKCVFMYYYEEPANVPGGPACNCAALCEAPQNVL